MIHYISSELLNWDINISSSSIGKMNDINRPYEIIAHSELLLNEKVSEFALSDSIANLKRALNHRLKVIEVNYNLKNLKYKNMPKGYLELLEEYGLIKPFMIKKLMEIRNDIEHNDAKPPSKVRCRELHDITWYFLKSTDRLIYYITESFELNPHKKSKLSKKYGGTLEIDNVTKDMKLRGWFPLEYLSEFKSENSIEIICSTINNGEYWKNKDNKYHRDKTKDDIWIIASLNLEAHEKKTILKSCFQAQ